MYGGLEEKGKGDKRLKLSGSRGWKNVENDHAIQRKTGSRAARPVRKGNKSTKG